MESVDDATPETFFCQGSDIFCSRVPDTTAKRKQQIWGGLYSKNLNLKLLSTTAQSIARKGNAA